MNDEPRVGLAFLLSQIGAHTAKAFGERLEALALRPPHAAILRWLATGEAFTQRSLAARLGMLPSQLVALLDALEARGCVTRAPDPADRRKHRLALTDAGRATHAEIERLTEALEHELFAALDPGERASLADRLDRVLRHQNWQPGVHPALRDWTEA